MEKIDILAVAGVAIHGVQWQRALAADLGVNERTLRRWVARDVDVPAGVWREIIALLEKQREKITDAAALIERAGLADH
ncbi:hypothetical protein [Paracoccus sp. (in: a-proteobacteria)]|uniref:hypothetical protein n=1 Tax=Paracoccus sp. TaxID=267 RepID=UPI0026E0A8D7|nr:hypothetical protein [Paracoccus sp. (in: a-proteobacteria)]MDO5648836.1 hypothetical protein [Paracoccus sp. (in: a-proteobacteria)]